MANYDDTIHEITSRAFKRNNKSKTNKPIYDVADIVQNELLSRGIQTDTVVGKDSIQFDIQYEGRKIHFFMQYDDEESE